MSHEPKKILLTGGTGLIGNKLTKLLLQKGYSVNHLSRKAADIPGVQTYSWNIDKNNIDERCIEGADIIIHLAGAGIADKRWSDKRKKEIIESRTKSIQLIYSLLAKHGNKVKRVISASAIGYYGDRGDELLTEGNPPNNDFIARCCVEWEASVGEGRLLGLKITKFRTGVVFAKGGALAKMALPIKLYVGSALGSGREWVPWIHLQDVIDMYLFAIENDSFEGVYNMVAPNPVTNKQLTQAIARQLHKPLWAPKVPAFVLKLLMGEMSTIALASTKVSCEKIEDAGFRFKYDNVADALKDIYG